MFLVTLVVMVKCVTSFKILTCFLHIGFCLQIEVTHDTRGFDVGAVTGWELNKQITVHLGLLQRNIDQLESLLNIISNPASASYGEWISNEEIANLISCPSGDIEKVENWLNENNILEYSISPTGDWIRATATLQSLEKLLACKFNRIMHRATGKLVYRPINSYSIPDDLQNIVEFIPSFHSLAFTNRKVKESVNFGRAFGNDPVVVKNKYHIQSPTEFCEPCNSTQAVVEFFSNNYNPSDIQTFFSNYAPDLVGQTVIQNFIEENTLLGGITIEANVDIQYIMSIGAFIDTYVYKQPSIDIIESFLDYVYFVGNQTQPPLVHSISWGDTGGVYDEATVQRINVEFIKMGLRGITLIVASGDNGVGCNDECSSQLFNFPSSPYVTLVGATELSRTNEEVGATLSSGGFSGIFSRPSWQDSHVSQYFAQQNVIYPPQSFYNPGGRAYPDVACYGVDMNLVYWGKIKAVDGTSISAPIFAAIISLLNAERTSAGKSPLGYINPWLYSNPQMFNDIHSGDNSYSCCRGFKSTTGWDPVTGLGSPDYQKMLTAAMNLP